MDSDAAELVAPEADAMAAGMLKLLQNKDLRHELGIKSKKLAQERCSMSAFKTVVNRLYDYIESISGNMHDSSTTPGDKK
jgi:glycosyltransferase involved in cell wall biosynthesis